MILAPMYTVGETVGNQIGEAANDLWKKLFTRCRVRMTVAALKTGNK
jgi:hypothetical protein